MAKRARNRRESVERKIYFYRIDAGSDAAGRPKSFDVAAALTHIESLPFDDGGRYFGIEDGNAICCWVDDAGATGKLRMGTVRRSGLPQVDRAGTLSDLSIPQSAGLVEQIHVVFFPNGIVGTDFNFYGPRLSKLSAYLAKKARGVVPPVVFEALLRQDVAEQLRQLSNVKLFQLKIRKSYVQRIASVDQSLGEAFRAAAAVCDAEAIEVTLAPEPYSRKGIGQRMLKVLRQLVGLRDLREESIRFHVKGTDSETGATSVIDLLSDKLVVRKKIIKHGDRSRALDSESAYRAIRAAYQDVEGELATLIGVQT